MYNSQQIEVKVKHWLLILTALFISAPDLFSQTYRLNGHVSDSETGQPLTYATVQVKENNTGTTTNSDGAFSLELPKGEYSVTVSFVGYQSKSSRITVPDDRQLMLALVPYSVIMPEVVIGSGKEDPAYGIIRKAIAKKAENREGLTRYSYEAYAKKIFNSAGQIALIDEAFVDGYVVPDKWTKEIPLATFKSENLKSKAGRTINMTQMKVNSIDFSGEEIEVMGNRVHLPLADDAVDYYKYRLSDTRKSGDELIYTIEVIPASDIRPLLKGRIVIEGSSYALIGVELSNNEGLSIPYTTDLSVIYEQKLNKYGRYWLPQLTRTVFSAGINFGGLVAFDKMEFDQIYSISKCSINADFPDSVQHQKKPGVNKYLTLADSAGISGPVELKQSQIDSLRPIPLSLSEIEAFAALDSTKRLKNFIKPKGTLAALVKVDDGGGDETQEKFSPTELLNYIDFSNSRVAGISLGARFGSSAAKNYIKYSGAALYSFGLKKTSGRGEIGLKLSRSGSSILSISGAAGVKRWQEKTQYPQLVNSINVTLGLEDNYNYLWAEGFSAGLQQQMPLGFSIHLDGSTESQSSLTAQYHHRIFKTNRGKRDNPEIINGRDNKVSMLIINGEDPSSLQIMPQNGFRLQLNKSLKAMGGDFDYWSMKASAQVRFKTIFRELFIAPYLLLKADAGYIDGAYGVQHILAPETSEEFLTSFGQLKGSHPYEFTGNKMVALHMEHNWRTVPFQSLGLNFLRNMNINLITGGSMLRMWNESVYKISPQSDDIYWELYGGISGIFGFIRADVAYTSTRRTVARFGASMAL